MAVYKRWNKKPVKPSDPNYDKGTWYVRRRIRGELIHKAIPEARSKRDAEQAEAKIIGDKMAKRFGFESRVTFSEFADEVYLKYVQQNNTNDYVKGLFVSELKRFFGNRRLADITAQDCRDFQHRRLHTRTKHGGPRATGSVNKELSTLSKLLNLACEQGIIHDSPMRFVKKLKEAPPRRKTLTDEQKAKLWAELRKDSLLFRLTVLAMNLPLRRGQILAITPDAIDLGNGYLLAAASKGKAARAVPLNSTAAHTLQQMIEDGQLPLPIKRFEKRWHKALEAVGLYKKGDRNNNFHFHDLRHYFGSELLRLGVNPYHIQDLFGHSDMKTSAIYLSPDMVDLSEAVKRLDVQEIEREQ